jgi:SOS-response transcriptional repressor LexA
VPPRSRQVLDIPDLLPTKSEEKLLLLIYHYTIDHTGEYPQDKWLQDRIGYANPSGVGNLKGKLRKKGYLQGQTQLTDKAWEYCKRRSDRVVPTSFRLYGTVRAGKLHADYTEAVIDDWMSDDIDEMINIPSITVSGDLCVLRVVGQSLEHEGIFENDYVIVQRAGNDERPRNEELIIASYLPFEDEVIVDDPSNIEAYLVGPVVKFYHETRNGVLLGWRKDRNSSPDEYRIQTNYVKFLGRVVGVYRSI